MIIRHVKLTGILSHEGSEVIFPDGIVAIVGSNGAGKSSIIDSIYVALFTDAIIDIRGHKKEFFIMRGKNKGTIEVSFEIGGVKYLIIKEIGIDTPVQASLYLLERDRRIIKSTGVSNVLNELSKILGLSVVSAKDLRSVIRSTIISLQDELTKIVEITDSERREWILSLLGLSYLEKSLETVKKKVAKKETLEGELKMEKKNLGDEERELGKYKKEQTLLIPELSKLKRDMDELQRKRDEVNGRIELINEALGLVDKLRHLFIIKRIEELENLRSRLKVLEGLDLNEYERIREGYERNIGELSEYKGQRNKLLQDVSNKLGITIDSYEALNKLLEDFREEEKKLEDSIARNNAVKELYSLYIEKFESTSTCPICGSLIKDPAVIKNNLTKKLDELNKEIDELDKERKNIGEKIDIIEGSLNILNKLNGSIETLERLSSENRRKLNELNEKVLQLCKILSKDFEGISSDSIDECIKYLRSQKDKLNGINKELEILSNLKREPIDDYSSYNIEVLQSRLNSIFTKLSLNIELPKKWEDVDNLRNKLNEILNNLNDLNSTTREKISKMRETYKHMEGQLEVIEKAIRKLEEEIKKSEGNIIALERQIKAYAVIYEFFNKYLGKSGLIAKELTRITRDELERRANRILAKLGLRPIEINDEFQIGIKVLGGVLPIGNASGGEKVGISIALRLALAELIMGRSPTTLILDEPTVYLDEERRTQIFEIIKELSKSLKQIIVVTQDESVMNIADKVIKVENIEGISKVVSQTL